MQVAWKNPNEPVPEGVQIKCGVCGIEGSWIEGYGFGVGYNIEGYDYFFGVCSDKCEEKAREGKLVLKTMIELNKSYAVGRTDIPKWFRDYLADLEKQYAAINEL